MILCIFPCPLQNIRHIQSVPCSDLTDRIHRAAPTLWSHFRRYLYTHSQQSGPNLHCVPAVPSGPDKRELLSVFTYKGKVLPRIKTFYVFWIMEITTLEAASGLDPATEATAFPPDRKSGKPTSGLSHPASTHRRRENTPSWRE
jgi:hypothetical protein